MSPTSEESSGVTNGYTMRVSLESVAIIVWAPVSPTLLGYRNWARNMSIGFLTLSKPGHSLGAWRNDGILPSPSSVGSLYCFAPPKPLTG